MSYSEVHHLRGKCVTCQIGLQEPYIRCAGCSPPVNLCLQCFAQGKETRRHSNAHTYEIISTDFPILERNWSASDELHLLDALEDCGLGNWMEVSKQMCTKNFEECENHYMTHYIKKPPPCLDIPELLPYDPLLLPQYKSLPLKVLEDPPRPAPGSAKASEMGGYMPCRADFDVEPDNYAEFDVKDVSFDPEDCDMTTELKLAVVKIYHKRLKRRWFKKWIVKRYGLLHLKKQHLIDRTMSKAEKELRDVFRPFSRLQDPEHQEMFIQGIILESLLKKQIKQMQEFRKVGITTRRGAEIYETLRKRREDQKNKRRALNDILSHVEDQNACLAWLQKQATINTESPLTPIPLPNLGRKPAARLDLSGIPGIEKLADDEKEICSVLRLMPQAYQTYKSSLIKECSRLGLLRLAQARMLIKIDVNKTRKLYDFFADKGWITKPDN